MAHLVVLLERTPTGLHPASSAALCLARDIADQKGASVTALCHGDAGPRDDNTSSLASRLGADQLIFLSPQGFPIILRRLEPRHVFVPWTLSARALYHQATNTPLQQYWIDDPARPFDSENLPRGLAVTAGTLPWQDCPDAIEAEYEGKVEEFQLPQWMKDEPAIQPGSQLFFGSSTDISEGTSALLHALGAKPFAPGSPTNQQSCLLWIGDTGSPAPEYIQSRSPELRVIYVPGQNAHPQEDWQYADWVLAGDQESALRELQGQPWRAELG